MVNADSLSGVVDVEGEKFHYSYEKGELLLQVSDKYGNLLSTSNRELPWDLLSGECYNGRKKVYFYISKWNYGGSVHFGPMSNYELKIFVKLCVISDMDLEQANDDIMITLYNTNFKKFLWLFEHHNLDTSNKELWIDNTSYNLSSTKNESNFIFNGINVTIKPDFSAKSSIVYFNYKVGLVLKYKDSSHSVAFMYELILHIRKILSFVFYRQNVSFDSISLSCLIENPVCVKGDIFLPLNNDVEMEQIDLAKTFDIGFIYWNNLFLYFSKLSDLITENKLCLYNLPLTKKYKNMTSFNSISLDASAFEYEFKEIYDSYKSSKCDNLDYKEVYGELSKLKENLKGNKKVIFSNTISSFWQPSLKEKLLKVVADYDFVLKALPERLVLNDYSKTIPDRIVKIRNSLLHGDKNPKIEQEDAQAFWLLKILIYSMQLKKIGYDEINIVNNIKHVFEIY